MPCLHTRISKTAASTLRYAGNWRSENSLPLLLRPGNVESYEDVPYRYVPGILRIISTFLTVIRPENVEGYEDVSYRYTSLEC